MAQRIDYIDSEPLIGRYHKALKHEVQKARTAILNNILIDRGLLEQIYQDVRRRQGEKSHKILLRAGLGVKVASPEDIYIESLILDDMRGELDDLAVRMQGTIEGLDAEGYTLGAREAQMRVGFSGMFTLRNPQVLNEIHYRAQGLGRLFTDDLADAILKDLRVGFYDKGLNPLTVARTINARFSEFGISRSENIARTETRIMLGSANYKSYRKMGVKMKEWGAHIDRKTRADHKDIADEDPIPMDEPFRMPHTGDLVMYPGDPKAPARQLCRCRCSLMPVVEEGTISEDNVWRGD